MKISLLFFLLFGLQILYGKAINPEYIAVTSYEEAFLALSSDGRIDQISTSGKIMKTETFTEEKLRCILSYDQKIIAAGVNGVMLISSDGKTFRKMSSGTRENINTLTKFKGNIIAGADRGEILIGDSEANFTKMELNLNGNIVSVSANNTYCYGVTDEGEIVQSTDGISWNIFDFNKVYEGYYQSGSFVKVLTTEGQIAVIGEKKDGSPALYFSNRGTVWTERTLVYTDEQGFSAYLVDIPNDIFYDTTQDRYILACNNGKVMTIPSCSHCNKLFAFTLEDLEGISGNDYYIIVVGKDKFLKILDNKYL